MELLKSIPENYEDTYVNDPYIFEKVCELRFDLYDWLKEKGLTAHEAIELLRLTRIAIQEAHCAESRKIKL